VVGPRAADGLLGVWSRRETEFGRGSAGRLLAASDSLRL